MTACSARGAGFSSAPDQLIVWQSRWRSTMKQTSTLRCSWRSDGGSLTCICTMPGAAISIASLGREFLAAKRLGDARAASSGDIKLARPGGTAVGLDVELHGFGGDLRILIGCQHHEAESVRRVTDTLFQAGNDVRRRLALAQSSFDGVGRVELQQVGEANGFDLAVGAGDLPAQQLLGAGVGSKLPGGGEPTGPDPAAVLAVCLADMEQRAVA